MIRSPRRDYGATKEPLNHSSIVLKASLESGTMFDDLEIRYHFPDEIDLDPGEPVILEKQITGTAEFVTCDVAPNDVRDIESIRALVRRIALDRGGEAWRAVTKRGEILCVYSVFDLADELGAKPVITLDPLDQLSLAVARAIMRVSVG